MNDDKALFPKVSGYPEMFGHGVKSKSPTAEEIQVGIISRKAALGDHEAARVSEEHGSIVALYRAKAAAEAAGRCSCVRGGIVCGRALNKNEGPACWPCYSRRKDHRACQHGGAMK